MTEIRQLNLKKLEAKYGSQVALAEILDTSTARVNHLLTGQRNIGEKTARKFEVLLGKPSGWMDTLGAINPQQPSSPILDKFNQLCPDQQKIIELMMDQLSNKPKSSENNTNKALTSLDENVGGVNLPVQSQQSQDQRGLTKTRPNQFEIDLAIEHERCVMVRHQEQMEANARYIELVKEKCQNNECYCEPPCENVETPLLGYMQIIEAVKK